MIRIMMHLNPADVREELLACGISSFERGEHLAADEYVFYKFSGASRAEVEKICSYLNRRLGCDLQLLPAAEPAAPSLVCCLPAQHRMISGHSGEDEPDSHSPLLAEFFTTLHNHLRSTWELQIPGGILRVDRPLIMGILNITPDSFSDGNRFLQPQDAFQHAVEMLEAGADIIDLGGESTRPGAAPVSADDEWKRISPVLHQLRSRSGAVISVDTYKSEVARRALENGAHIINDISALQFDPRMAGVIAAHKVPVVLMHLLGTPRTMQQNPRYDHLMEELIDYFSERICRATESGIRQIIVDPGIGFGKRPADNFEIIRRLPELKVFGYPVLLGPSRKSFIKSVCDVPAEQRIPGTITSIISAVYNKGAHIFRVHDVAEIQQSFAILKAIREAKAVAVQ